MGSLSYVADLHPFPASLLELCNLWPSVRTFRILGTSLWGLELSYFSKSFSLTWHGGSYLQCGQLHSSPWAVGQSPQFWHLRVKFPEIVPSP